MIVLLDFPESKLRDLENSSSSDFQSKAARELVLALYRDGRISSGRAMALTGLTRRELWETAQDRDRRMAGKSDPSSEW